MLSFTYFKPFLDLKHTAGPDWSNKFSKLMNTDFAFRGLWKTAIFRYGRFEVKELLGTSGFMK